VSFDIFLQSFKDGDAAPGDPEAAWRVLAPYLAGALTGGYARVRTPDGEAAVYGAGRDALMINHASGQIIWQIMVDVARAADWVIMPVGCPVCVLREEMINDLPAELQDDAVVVGSGAEVLDVVPQA
jgi:hypothetical protein